MFAIVLLSASLLGGEATVGDVFVVNVTTARLAAYLQVHPEAVLCATGATLIARRGDLTRVAKETIKGRFDFTVQEKIQPPGKLYVKSYIYDATLARCDAGNVTQYHVHCILAPLPATEQTLVQIDARMAIDNRRVHDVDVRIGMNAAMKAFRRFMEGLR